MSNADRLATEKKVALAPDIRMLSERGVRAWVEGMAVQQRDEGYLVETQSGGRYLVDLRAGTCSCPDHRIRGETCKHLRRVAIEITARRVPPPDKRRADCVACGTETFVSTGAESPPLCSNCRLDSGDVVCDRETGDRLVVVDVTRTRADEVEIDRAETTVAAYPTNEGYPADDVVVEVVYVADISAHDDPTRYSFPISRLEPADDAALIE
jgi:hypothetical protein